MFRSVFFPLTVPLLVGASYLLFFPPLRASAPLHALGSTHRVVSLGNSCFPFTLQGQPLCCFFFLPLHPFFRFSALNKQQRFASHDLSPAFFDHARPTFLHHFNTFRFRSVLFFSPNRLFTRFSRKTGITLAHLDANPTPFPPRPDPICWTKPNTKTSLPFPLLTLSIPCRFSGAFINLRPRPCVFLPGSIVNPSLFFRCLDSTRKILSSPPSLVLTAPKPFPAMTNMILRRFFSYIFLPPAPPPIFFFFSQPQV